MLHPNSGHLMRIRRKIAPVLLGPPILAFLPAVTLATFWLGGEVALLTVALGMPVLFGALGAFGNSKVSYVPRDSVTGMLLREGFEMVLEQVHIETDDTSLRSAVMVLEIDDYKELITRHGQSAGDSVVQRCGERIIETLRDKDTVARIGDSKFAICLTPVQQLDLELTVQLAGRLQTALEEPISLDLSFRYAKRVTLLQTIVFLSALRWRCSEEQEKHHISEASSVALLFQKINPMILQLSFLDFRINYRVF